MQQPHPDPFMETPELQSVSRFINAADGATEPLHIKHRMRLRARQLRGAASLLDQAATTIEHMEMVDSELCRRLTASQKEAEGLRSEIEKLRAATPSDAPAAN